MEIKSCKDCLHSDGYLCMRRAKREGVVVVGAQKLEVARTPSLNPLECSKKGRYWKPKE